MAPSALDQAAEYDFVPDTFTLPNDYALFVEEFKRRKSGQVAVAVTPLPRAPLTRAHPLCTTPDPRRPRRPRASVAPTRFGVPGSAERPAA